MPLHSSIKSSFTLLDVIDSSSHSIMYMLLKYIIDRDAMDMMVKVVSSIVGTK